MRALKFLKNRLRVKLFTCNVAINPAHLFTFRLLVREAEAKLAEEAAAQKEKEDLLLEIKLKVI